MIKRLAALVFVWATVGFAQNVVVLKGSNPMDGQVWIRLEINAAQPFATSYGSSITPTIAVECDQKGKQKQFGIFLQVGVLAAPVDTVFTSLPSGDRLLRTKVDDGKPRWHSWREMTDGKTYQYVGMGETGLNQYSDSRFLKDLFSARRLLVEFQPSQQNGTVTSEFDMRGLKEEFDKHQECRGAK